MTPCIYYRLRQQSFMQRAKSEHNQNKSICKFIPFVRLICKNKFIKIKFMSARAASHRMELRRSNFVNSLVRHENGWFSSRWIVVIIFEIIVINKYIVLSFCLRSKGADTWYNEYKRLTYNTPMVLTDELQDAHSHQVLHVSFSHNGRMFATCSKDGYVLVTQLWQHWNHTELTLSLIRSSKIWNSSYPATVKYSHDMKKFSWKYTQFSQFNQSDTLLLVSGVHFGSPHSTSGEIAVFSVTGESATLNLAPNAFLVYSLRLIFGRRFTFAMSRSQSSIRYFWHMVQRSASYFGRFALAGPFG